MMNKEKLVSAVEVTCTLAVKLGDRAMAEAGIKLYELLKDEYNVVGFEVFDYGTLVVINRAFEMTLK